MYCGGGEETHISLQMFSKTSAVWCLLAKSRKSLFPLSLPLFRLRQVLFDAFEIFLHSVKV